MHVDTNTDAVIHRRPPRVALVAMPWASAWMPSIQLSVLRRCLEGVAEHDSYELNLDYAALISEHLYQKLCEAGGMIEEYVFSQSYFPPEGHPMPEGFLDEFPSFGLSSREIERTTVDTLTEVTRDFIERMRDAVDWSRYDVVAFTLTIYQTAASMALARAIRRKHPEVRIVFGGNSCVGPAARAMLEVCSYVDVVVRTEAEPVFAPLVRHLTQSRPLGSLPGISFRGVDGGVVETPPGLLHHTRHDSPLPDYDAYFQRFDRLHLSGAGRIWLPFESSRGCWWGEKSQCTFCGLHDIMQSRIREPEDVLRELDWLHERHGVSRFFATDLILPHTYYRTLLPELIRSRRGYRFFYELKANVTREKMATLTAAGVKNVQPGLESLSTSHLKLMKKGVTATQNVELLRWAAEYGIYVGWNLIVGMPLEDPRELELAAERCSRLHHLQPPHFINFELNRFSPIFEDTGTHGLRNVRPLYLYRYVYPVEERLRSALAYRFEYDASDFGGTPPWLGGEGPEYGRSLRVAVDRWQAAHENGAGLRLRLLEDGGLEILDTRRPEEPTTFRFDQATGRLYLFFDARRSLERAGTEFDREHPDLCSLLGGVECVQAQVELWLEQELLFEEGGLVLALAVPEHPLLELDPDSPELDGAEGHVPLPVAIGSGLPVLHDAWAPVEDHNVALLSLPELPDPASPFRPGPGSDAPPFPSDPEAMSHFLRGIALPEGHAPDVALVERKMSVREAFLVHLRGGGAVFVKEERIRGAGELHENGRALLGSRSPGGSLPIEPPAGLAPRRLAHDPVRGIGVYEAVEGHDAWMDLFDSASGFDPSIAAAVAERVAGLHSVVMGPDCPVPAAAPEAPIRCYDDLTVADLAGAPGLHFGEFLRLVQRAGPALAELRRGWTSSHRIHGDLKADNILVRPEAPGWSVRFVDWELSRAGDPLFDLGTLVGSVVAAWLASVPSLDGGGLEDWIGASPVDSWTLVRCLDALLVTYFARTHPPDKPEARRRAWRYAGVFLLERGLVANALAGRMSLGDKLAAELGARILVEPERATMAFGSEITAA